MFKTGKHERLEFKYGKHAKETKRVTSLVAIMTVVVLLSSFVVTISPTIALFNDFIESSTNLVLGDWTPPVITLDGDNPIIIVARTSYTEPGYTAIDDVDGDITENVVITNNIDINTVGTYEIEYTVVDVARKQYYCYKNSRSGQCSRFGRF